VIHYSYFTIRIQNAADASGERSLAGVIERLATGEKHEFGSGSELIELVTAWSCGVPKMAPTPDRTQ
jgi:hypothetical protein